MLGLHFEESKRDVGGIQGISNQRTAIAVDVGILV